MTERTAVVTPTDVRYGFNGKEVDNEINGNGNAYDFGARTYDARLGRSYSLDPKLVLTPFHSGYSFFSNNPIYFIDKDGKIIEVATESSKTSFNTAVQSVFKGNDAAIAALSISADAMPVRPISVEDYNKIIQSLNSIDQQAAFRGLYLASESQSKYLVQVIEGNEKAFINGDAVSTEYLNKFDGVSIGKDETNSAVLNAPIFEVSISRDKECSQIPEQLRFTVVHYTTGVEKVKTLPNEK